MVTRKLLAEAGMNKERPVRSLLINRPSFVSWAKTESSRLGAIVDGTPLVLLKENKWQNEIVNGMRLGANDVMAAARTKGLRDLSQIKYAILERNGTISVIKKNVNAQ
jgi:uncharacterized membrane protein YcaP (DUF421 family)